MSPKELYEFSKKYNCENAQIYVPQYEQYDDEGLMTDVNHAKVIVHNDEDQPVIMLTHVKPNLTKIESIVQR